MANDGVTLSLYCEANDEARALFADWKGIA